MSKAWNMLIYGGMITEDICIPNYIFKLIITVFIPPIGMIMDEHSKGYTNVNRIVISIILTMMFYFPGLIYTLSSINLN